MTTDEPGFPLPPGFHISDRGVITLTRNTPPSAEELAWMWHTSQAIRRDAGLPPLEPNKRRR